jgi:tRNA(fMet)-specific endonuclease VapC
VSIGHKDLLLLDTNVLVHWIRQDSTGQYLQRQYELDKRADRPLYSTVTEGEILGLAMFWKWGPAKREALNRLLGELVRFESSHPEVVQLYAELYDHDLREGLSTGENDLWIAASAKATSSILLTCDGDFLRLSPTHLRVEFVDAKR